MNWVCRFIGHKVIKLAGAVLICSRCDKDILRYYLRRLAR